MTSSQAIDTSCPKCSHVRAPGEPAPAWQCPSCGIAYHKYRAILERTKAGLAPRAAGDDAPTLVADSSVWMLLIANGVVLFIALVAGWRLADLMSVYWLQSVVIGGSYFMRIMSLERFSTEDFRINGKRVDPTPETKRQTAFFFLLHYGGFHIGYLVFIATEAPGGIAVDLGLLVCAIAFVVDHVYSYRYHRELDRQGTPNIGTLMFTPYLRIIPMHLTIVIGALALESAGVLFFGLLKTGADVGMHIVEHRILGKQREKELP